MRTFVLLCGLLALCSCASSPNGKSERQPFARARCAKENDEGKCVRCLVRASDMPKSQRRNLTSSSKAMRFVCENMAQGEFRATALMEVEQEAEEAGKGPTPRYALSLRLEIIGEAAGAMVSTVGSDPQPCTDDAPCAMRMKCSARPSKDGEISGYLVMDACQLGGGPVACALSEDSLIEIARAEP